MPRHFTHVLDPRLPTLVAGDFNEDEGGRAIRHLEAQGLRSVLGEFRPGARTWRWHTRLGPITHMLDHILYSDDLSPLEARVIDAGRSDHLPVVARFQRVRRHPAGVRLRRRSGVPVLPRGSL